MNFFSGVILMNSSLNFNELDLESTNSRLCYISPDRLQILLHVQCSSSSGHSMVDHTVFRLFPGTSQLTFFLLSPVLLQILVFGIGLIMYTFYLDCDPLKQGLVSTGDQLTVHFVTQLFHDMPGMSGLFVASVLGYGAKKK